MTHRGRFRRRRRAASPRPCRVGCVRCAVPGVTVWVTGPLLTMSTEKISSEFHNRPAPSVGSRPGAGGFMRRSALGRVLLRAMTASDVASAPAAEMATASIRGTKRPAPSSPSTRDGGTHDANLHRRVGDIRRSFAADAAAAVPPDEPSTSSTPYVAPSDIAVAYTSTQIDAYVHQNFYPNNPSRPDDVDERRRRDQAGGSGRRGEALTRQGHHAPRRPGPGDHPGQHRVPPGARLRRDGSLLAPRQSLRPGLQQAPVPAGAVETPQRSNRHRGGPGRRRGLKADIAELSRD